MERETKIKSSSNEVLRKYAKHSNPAFIKLLKIFGYGRIYTSARDVRVQDSRGREYLDLLSGFGSVNIGHNHPRLKKRLAEFLSEDHFNFNHLGPSPLEADLAESLCEGIAPLQIALFASSGAEAVEAGMKLARAYTRRKEFIYCEGGFHGTNFGALSIMGSKRMRHIFEPLLPHCTQVPFGNLEALTEVLKKKNAAAFIVEPVQSEAGINFPDPAYLKEAQKLCEQYGTLLVLDEVQTGLGRLGTMFAFEQYDFTPDILVLAKSLSGGLAPVSATLTRQEIYNKAYGAPARFDLHSSTYEANALSCVTALENLAIIREEELVLNAKRQGELFLRLLRERLAGHPLVRDIRGQGLLIGVEFGPTEKTWTGRNLSALVKAVAREIYGQWIAVTLLEKGIICQPASQNWNVLRIEPPLTIQETDVRHAVEIIGATLDEHTSIPDLLGKTSRRIFSKKAKAEVLF